MDEELQDSPDEFRDEIQQHADEAVENMAAPELSAMENMEATAQDDVAEEVSPPPEMPAQSEPPPELSVMENMQETAVELNPVEATSAEPPELSRMEDMQESAVDLEPTEATLNRPSPTAMPSPEVAAMGSMASTAKEDAPPERPQLQQIERTQLQRELNLFENDAGEFDATATGMDHVQADSARWESQIMVNQLLAQFAVDHRRAIDQIYAMLERNR